MPAAPKPDDETLRLARLRAMNILDTGREAVFDTFTRLAGSVFAMPISALSLVDEQRQWFKSIQGLDVAESPRDQAFCAHAILHPREVMVVEDAAADARFADNPLVLGGPRIRFYAGAPVFDAQGMALGTLCVIDSVPRHFDAAARAQLADMAAGVSAALELHGALQSLDEITRTDALTGVGSRMALDRAMRQLRDNPPRDGSVAIIMIDMDGFKLINDVFGHAGGDAALREVASRLRRVLRPRDLVARLGGDEFVVLCHGVRDLSACAAIEARLHTAMADTFTLNGTVVPLRISAGSAIFPLAGAEPETVLALADAALYAQKRDRKGGGATAGFGRLKLREALHAALLPPGHEPFILRFQPIIALAQMRRMHSLWPPTRLRARDATRRAGDASALEALVRWPMPDGQVVPPGDFIHLAEEAGLISHIDRWVLNHACRQAMTWPIPWGISVNLSAAHVVLGGVEEMVREALGSTGLEPARLTLELTETVLAADRDRALSVINGLRRMGVGVALDDFGGGHASLTYLNNFPFSVVKVDRTQIAGLLDNSRAEAVLATVVELGHTLGVPVVAEGVETLDQLRLLARLGVDRAQGFFLGRPVSEEAVSGAVDAAEQCVAAAMALERARGAG